MKKIDKHASLHRFLLKKKTMLLSAALAIMSLGVATSESQAQILLDEDFTGQTLPTGWDTTDVTGSGFNWSFNNPGTRDFTGTTSSFDTDFAIFDSDEYGGSLTAIEEAILESPAFDASTATGAIILSFDNSFRNYSSGVSEAHVEVWDGTTWTDVLTITGANDGYPDANQKSVDITTAAGGSTAAKVRFRWANGDYDYWWAIDNVIVETVSCFWPTALTATNVTSATADISWTAPGTPPANGYEYYYNTTGTAPTATTTPSGSVGAGVTTASLTGLSPTTQYYVWVRSVCSGTDQSNWSSSIDFVTACGASAAPFVENLDGGSLPACWTSTTDASSTSSNVFWKFSGNPGYGAAPSLNGRTSGTYAWVDASSPYTGVHEVTLMSPEINLTGLTTAYLQFEWFKNHDNSATNPYDNNELSVSVTADGGTTWTEIFADTSNAPNWRLVGLTLPATIPANATIQLKFVVDKDLAGDGYFYDDLLLDNIEVKEAPSCFMPLQVVSSNVTDGTADISWTAPTPAPANGYEYYYNTTGTAPTATTTANGSVGAGVTTATLSGLSALTDYYVWVRSICSATEKSDWSFVSEFTTLPAAQTPATLPYSDDFTGTATDWTLMNGAETNAWYISSAVGNTGSSLYISDDNGTTHQYTTGDASVVQAYRDVTFPANGNPYSMNFDYMAKGEGFSSTNYDYFRVWIVPTSFTPTPGTQINTTASGGVQLSDNINDQSTWTSEGYLLSDTLGGNTWRVVFEWRNDGSSGTQPPAAIDNLNITEITCMAPSAVTVDAVGITDATISWTPPTTPPAGGYDYYYSTTGTAPTATTTPSGSTAAGVTSAPLSGLTANTEYFVWVRSNCGSGNIGLWNADTSFTTLCSAVVAPYTEDLDGGALPSCWISTTDATSTSSNAFWKFDGSPGYGAAPSLNGRTSGTFAWVDASSPYDDIHAVTLTTVPIDLSALTNPFVEFEWFKNNDNLSYGNNKLTVEVRDITTNTWTVIFEDTSNSANWRLEGIPLLPAYQNTTIQVRFVVDKDLAANGYFYDDLLLDNVQVKEMPVCAVPDTLSATNITQDGADVSWTGDPAADYLVEYGLSGFTPGSGTTILVTGLTTPISNLDPNTDYDFYVRLICTGSLNDTSAYSLEETFTTLCDVPVIPLSDTAQLCQGGTVSLDAGNPGATYLWSDNSTSQVLDVTTAGAYWVEVTNTFGCTAADTVTVVEIATPTVDLGGDQTSCGGNPVTLDAGNPGNSYIWNTAATTQTITVTTAGTYYVTVTNAEGCAASDTVTVEFTDAPEVQGITAVLQSDGTYNMTAVGTENVNEYLWDFGDGNTSTLAAPNHNYTVGGNYTITVIVFNDCGSDTATADIHVEGTSIDDLSLDHTQLTLFPNPARHTLNIENKSSFKMEHVTVYNVLGQVVFDSKVNDSQQYRIDVASFSSGIYNIRIQMDKGIVVRKFEILR